MGCESEVTRLPSALSQREGREEGGNNFRQSWGSLGTRASWEKRALLDATGLPTCRLALFLAITTGQENRKGHHKAQMI